MSFIEEAWEKFEAHTGHSPKGILPGKDNVKIVYWDDQWVRALMKKCDKLAKENKQYEKILTDLIEEVL